MATLIILSAGVLLVCLIMLANAQHSQTKTRRANTAETVRLGDQVVATAKAPVSKSNRRVGMFGANMRDD